MEACIDLTPSSQTFTRFPVSPETDKGTSHAFINHIAQAPDSTIWIGTDAGLDAYKNGTFTHYTYEAGGQGALRSPIVTHITMGHENTIWIATHAGLHELDPATGAIRLRELSINGAPENTQLNVLFQDKDGILWIGSDDGLITLDPQSNELTHFQHLRTDPGTISSDRVHAIAQDIEGVMWIGTLGNDISDGLNRFDANDGSFTRYRMDPDDPFALSSNRVLSLLPDENGLLWVGTHTHGVNMADLHGERITHLTANNSGGIPENEIYSVHADTKGTIWIGTWSQGLGKLDQNTNTIQIISPATTSLTGSNILDILEDDEYIWVGTFHGLNKIHTPTGRIETYNHDQTNPATLISNSATAIERDRSGNLWVGSWGDGMSMLPAGSSEFIRFSHNPDDSTSLPEQHIFKIREDNRGILWLKSWESLYSYDHRSGHFQKLPVEKINDFTFDNTGGLWLATSDKGLVHYSLTTRESHYYSVHEGLPHESVTGLVADANDDIWAVTARGIARLNRDEGRFHNYVPTPLIRGNKMGKNSASRGPDGALYFASGNGLFRLQPKDFSISNQMVPARLTEVHISSTSGMASETMIVRPASSIDENRVTLKHSQKNISFLYAGLGYRKPPAYQYRYRLHSYDESWIPAGPTREARYTNLTPGKYQFEVQAANEDGIWNIESSLLNIWIRPPWWNTTAAYFFYVIFCGSVLIGIIRYRETSLKRRARELEDQVQHRTQEIENSRKIIAAQAERLVEHDKLKSRFFANISHEFRTPLTLILGPLRDAQRGIFGQISHKLLRQIQMMERNGRRLQSLINQLLELAKFESGSIKLEASQVDSVRLTQRIVRSFSSLAERKGIRLSMKALWLEKDKQDPDLYVDEAKYEQALNNLLSNALKFTPEGGEVRVLMDQIDNQLKLDVIDSGTGIPESEFEHIFDRFKQLHPRAHDSEGSSGIGLALAKEWIELHQGSLSVRNRKEGGACFTILLPLGASHLQADEIIARVPLHNQVTEQIPAIDEFEVFLSDAASQAPSGSAHLATVLLVEDHSDLRSYIHSHLSTRYNVVEAIHGKDALERAHKEKPDLIISDVMMPEMDGYALCKAVKDNPELADVPVILLTAKANEEDKVDGLRTGADDYMYKPFSANELMARAENLIDIRSHLRKLYSTQIFEVSPEDVQVESADSAFMRQVLDLVEQHIDNPNFSTEWMADEIGLSPRQVRRRIKELTNLSATGFLRTLRLQRAAQLLSQEAGTISEVAYAVGFNDPKYFSRLFRQVYGVSPSDYKG